MVKLIKIESKQNLLDEVESLKQQGFLISNNRLKFLVKYWEDIEFIYGDLFSRTISCVKVTKES